MQYRKVGEIAEVVIIIIVFSSIPQPKQSRPEVRRKQVPFRMTIEKIWTHARVFPEHLSHGPWVTEE